MKSFLTLCSILLCALLSNAQTIIGKVFDENSNPIEGVNVLHRASDNHTHSNANGEFSIEGVTKGDTLLFTHISFEIRQFVITETSSALQVQLASRKFDLGEVVISREVNALNVITEIDLATRPVNNSQEVLMAIPGIFIGQHAGGGKAEQLFLRGFDLDHGTDINITVDGMPVNMVSHAHGQGYSDLHFVIPETIEEIDFGKGPYFQEKGNFTTAGYVDFRTKDKVDNSLVKMEVGQFNTARVMGMFNVLDRKNQSAYVASEFLSTDGPFESPQNFNRINLFGKYTGLLSNSDRIEVLSSYFTSKWDASGQIPQRAIDNGTITRFGAIDDTEGGSTSRANLSVQHVKTIDSKSSIRSQVYLSQYDFELYSNFTFFLDDPINGDQIKQKESRFIYGLTSDYKRRYMLNNLEGSIDAGIMVRNDAVSGNELSHTLNRSETLNPIQLGDVNETNLGAHFGTTMNLKKWTFNAGIRADYFDFQYNDALQTTYETKEEVQAIFSPKLNILFHPTQKLQLYLKAGQGFHSNDTRVVVAQRGRAILPAAYGGDLGFIWKPTSKMVLNIAGWYLDLEQEFVYVGDAGIVEPSGASRRIGIDFSYRYQPISWLFWNLDANYAFARSIDEPSGSDHIPLAPDLTIVSGITVKNASGLAGGFNVRYLKDRPANEDNTIVAEGYTVADLNISYTWTKLTVGTQIQNLFDTEWNETQFATESRMRNEVAPVEEIHITPGVPFFAKVIIQYAF